jgi:ATP-dependent helicase HrpA
VPGNPKIDPDGIHQSLLSGLLSQIGLKQLSDKKNADKSLKSEKPVKASNEYLGSNGKKFVIFPGSTLAKKPPVAVMSSELVETSRLFARMNAAINPEWAEELAGDLAKSSYSEPHWEKSQGAVVAYERVILFGVPIVVSRRMQYSRIDTAVCRDLFIRHALVQGEWDSKQQFDRENKTLLKKLESQAEKSPKPMFAPDDEDVFHFYNARIPADVISTRTFEGWWKKAKLETPELLTMTREDLMPQDVKEVRDLPEFHVFDGHRLRLRYRYEPSAQDDGATVDVPFSLLSEIESHSFEWLVPELREELVAELIRLLPKNLRRNVVPAADWAKKALAALPEHPVEPLSATLAKTLRTLSGTHMTASDFPLSALPTSLRMTYRVIDENNRTLGLSLDLDALKGKLLPAEDLPQLQIAKVDNRKQLNELAKEVVKLVPNPADYIAEHLDKNEKLAIAAVGYRGIAAFVEDVVLAIAIEQMERTGITAKPQEIAQEVTGISIEKCFEIAKLILKINTSLRDANKSITDIQDVSLLFVLSNEKKHIGELLVPKLVSGTGITQLTRLPIYLQAIKIRMDKLVENSERDRLAELELNQALALYENASPEKRPAIRWLIEELRISLFAQTLGTTESVSVQRIKKALT